MSCRNEKLIKNSGDLTRLLVRTPSYQPEGNEADIIQKIKGIFPDDVEKQVIDHGKNRASLIVRIPGREKGKGLAFVGHIDTVALGDLSLWKYPPLDAVEEDGLIYGRGAADMKAGAAAMITAALCVLDSKQPPRQDLLFCFTADEEAGGMGVRAIVEMGVLDDVAEIIIAEPSDQKIGLCEKGAFWLRVESHGVSAHGSRPEIGLNAVEALINFHRKLMERLDTTTEHPLLGKTTVSVTKFTGGIMTNIIPEEAVMELDIRTLPSLPNSAVSEAAEQVAAELIAGDSRLELKLTVLNDRPAVETPPEAPMVRRLTEIFRSLDLDPTPKGLFFYTDMSQIAPRVKAPFLILGPGDDKMAHKINEFVPRQAVETISRVYIAYIENYYMGES